MLTPSRALTVAALLLAAPTAGCGQTASAPPRTAAVHADSASLLADLSWLADDAREGRAPLTPASEAVRRRIADVFRDAGVRSFGPGGYERPFTRPGSTEPAGVNVVGWLPGTGVGLPWIVVTAHFDHVGVRGGEVYNGADDNASGTAALLFLARHLAERPLPHPVVLAALDTEEQGLVGAHALVADPPVARDSMALNINLDMLSRGAGTLWAAGAHHTPWLAPVLDEVAARAPMTLRQGHDRPGVPGQDDWTQSSDHGAFHAAGLPWVYFGVEDHPDVHAPTDDVERIDPSDYLNAVRTVVLALDALSAHLAVVRR